MDIHDRWAIPPDSVLAELEIRAICGGNAALIRAALVGILGLERAEALAETLSPSAARLLRTAPAAGDWIPVSDIRQIVDASGIIKPLMESGVRARLTAEWDAGRLPAFGPPAYEKLLPGDSPRDLLMALDANFKARYQGGGIHLDALEAQEAWVSLWAQEHLWHGWASHEVTEWFKRVLEDHYKVRSAVTYMAPPQDRPWWHRYHIRWF